MRQRPNGSPRSRNGSRRLLKVGTPVSFWITAQTDPMRREIIPARNTFSRFLLPLAQALLVAPENAFIAAIATASSRWTPTASIESSARETGFQIHSSIARTLGGSGPAGDRIQRALSDLLRHRHYGILPCAWLSLSGRPGITRH